MHLCLNFEMETALIYQWYEKGVILPEKLKNGHDNMSYECKTCKKKISSLKSIIDFTYFLTLVIYLYLL